MNSSFFVEKASVLLPDAKVIIIGSNAMEAKVLINKQTLPFGYINKEDDKSRIEESLLFLILKSLSNKK